MQKRSKMCDIWSSRCAPGTHPGSTSCSTASMDRSMYVSSGSFRSRSSCARDE